MKFCKLFRFFNPTLENQKRRNSHVYVTRNRRCSVKKVFLKISQISQENTCVGVFFSKVVGLFKNANLSKLKETPAQVFL